MSRAVPVEDASEPGHLHQSRARISIESRIDAAPGRAFALLSCIYFVAVLLLSAQKLLWLDELITLHIARLGGPGAIWAALQRGADPNPPVTHLLVHYSRLLFGEHEFALRLPAMIGYWLGMLCLFQFLRRRVPGTWAIGGVLLSVTMAAFEYSFESRSYGIFYGLAMAAFFCWIQTVDSNAPPRARTLALIGMIAALTAGISTNYFAVLAFFPVAIGEAVRTLERNIDPRTNQPLPILRRIDLRIWLGLVIAGSTLLTYRELIAHSIAQFAPYAWNKVSLDQAFDSYTEMVEMVLWPLLCLFVFSLGAFYAFPAATRSIRVNKPLPWHEVAAILGLMAYPLLGYVIASIRGGMLSPRFVIPVCFGFAIAGTIAAHRTFGNARRAGLVFACFLLAWFLCRESVVGYWYREQKQSFYRLLDQFPQAQAAVAPGAPIVIPDPLLALTFQHYAPPNIASRIYFPVDFPAIRRLRGDDSPEENLWAGRNFLYSLKILPIASFQNSSAQYLIIASRDNWMLRDLADHHFSTTLLPVDTHADEMGFFTPLAHGKPSFFIGSWEWPPLGATPPSLARPVPFVLADNLPSAGRTEGGELR